MRVLLINPPQIFYPGSEAPAGNLPLGLMYIAAMLEKAGVKVEILDAFMTNSRTWKTGETTFVGMPYRQIADEIRRRKPDIVGVSNPFTCQVENAIKTCDVVKEIDPRILTVVGGPHVTAVPKEFLEQAKSVDIAVIGEGEYTMLDIAKVHGDKKKLGSVLGIAYRKNGGVILTPPRPFINNLDELPFPAYHLVDMEQCLDPKRVEYRSFKERSISMITSRGCPFNCCFCSVHLHMGKKFRAHSVDYVVKHIEYVVEKYRVKNIFFEDDNLTLDTERFEAICDGIIRKDIRLNWETPNGVRADALTLNLLKKMKKSGCQSVFIGVESGDQNVLDKIIDKSLNLNAVTNVAKMCKAIGLKTGAFYIIGFPGEKKENMRRTIDFALALKKEFDVGMHLFIATPSVGTRLYEECQRKGYLRGNQSMRSFAEARQPRGLSMIETKDFTREEVRQIASTAVKMYKKLNLLCHVMSPGDTLKTALDQPTIVLRFVRSFSSV